MQTKATPAGERHELVRWRRNQLVQTGFPFPLAARLAREAHYDLHALIELAERGCPPELAVRILAPLGSESVA
jgi:hypothetical protein